MGGLSGFHRALERVSNSGIFIGILLRQSLWSYVERDWLIGNISEMYVTLVPWTREWRRNVPSPRFSFLRRTGQDTQCTAGAHSLGSSAKNWCAFASALLLYPCCRAGSVWQNTHVNCHWLVLLTLEGDWTLEQDPTTSVTLMLHLLSLLQGTRVTYVTEMLIFPFLSSETACSPSLWWRTWYLQTALLRRWRTAYSEWSIRCNIHFRGWLSSRDA